MSSSSDDESENYFDRLQNNMGALPPGLKKNLNRMNIYDSKVKDIMKTVDKRSAAYLKNFHSMPPAEEAKKKEEIQKLYAMATDYSNKKIQLAEQTYKLVDDNIKQFDADLTRYKADLKANHQSLAVAGESSGEMQKKKARKSVPSGDKVPKFVLKKMKAQAAKESSDSKELPGFAAAFRELDVCDLPVNKNEPTYCSCNKVAYGEMIGCDNPDCPIEWYHFECVGLTSKPESRWYCSKCLAKPTEK